MTSSEDEIYSRLEREFHYFRDASLPGFKEDDANAFRFVKSWSRFPAFHEFLNYHGVNLGEMSEWALVQEVMSALEEEGRYREQ